MKSTNTHKAHKTENGRTTKCGIRLNSYSDIINDEGMKIPTKHHFYKFNPYKYEGDVCEKCND
jgi:hypothetical protein